MISRSLALGLALSLVASCSGNEPCKVARQYATESWKMVASMRRAEADRRDVREYQSFEDEAFRAFDVAAAFCIGAGSGKRMITKFLATEESPDVLVVAAIRAGETAVEVCAAK